MAAGIESLESRRLLAAMFRDNEILVQFAPTATASFRDAVRGVVKGQAAETVLTPAMRNRGAGALERITIGNGMTVEQAAKAVARQPGVMVAQPNYVITTAAVSNDPNYTTGNGTLNSRLWGMYGDDVPTASGPTGTTNAFGSQAEKAWDAGFTGARSVVVGIVDSGIDVRHPDLAANIWVNPNETAGDGIDNDGNGYVDDVNGWDFVNNDNTVYDAGESVHGTHVAGTIGAVGGNGTGVVGVSWNVSMISAKFLGADGTGTLLNAIRALDYLADLKTRNGVNIVASNNSWGGNVPYDGLLHDAVIRQANANILFVAAAGNGTAGSTAEGDDNDSQPVFPANYSTTQPGAQLQPASYDAVISVAALGANGELADFSNFGRTTVDLAAPGVGIVSTLPGGTYGSLSGTSMAAPHVTGAIALYASRYPGESAAAIRNAMLSTARPTPSLAGQTVTGGRLDVYAAINKASVPGAVLNLNATAGSGDGRVNLSWTAPASAGNLTLSDYVVQYRRSSDSTWSTYDDGTSTGTTASVSGLMPGVSYSFQVSAVNSLGNGSASSVASATVSAPAANVTAGTEGSSVVVRFTPRDTASHVATVTWTGSAFEIAADGGALGTFPVAGVTGVRVVGSVTNDDRVEFRAAAGVVSAMTVGIDVDSHVEFTTIGLSIDTTDRVDVRSPAQLPFSIRTTGGQRYLGAVTLSADNTSIDAGADLSFGSTINPATVAQNLSVRAVGDIRFGGAVGGRTSLGSLAIDAARSAVFAGPVTINGSPTQASNIGLRIGAGVGGVDLVAPGSSISSCRGSGLRFVGGSNQSRFANLTISQCRGDGVSLAAGDYGDTILKSVVSRGNGNAGIGLRGAVTGVQLGVKGVGVTATGNVGGGVWIGDGTKDVSLSSGTFSGNFGSGVSITGLQTNGVFLDGCFVGTTATSQSLGNTFAGIQIQDASNVVVKNSVIGANQNFGIYVGNAKGTTIDSSFIGVNGAGTTQLGNGIHGIWVNGSTGTTVRRSTITASGKAGIEYTSSQAGRITGNTISSNRSFGISTSGDLNQTSIDNNTISQNDYYGMYVNAAKGLSIDFNNIANNIQGIVIGGDSTGTRVAANTISSNASGGIIALQAVNLTIGIPGFGNSFGGTSAYGLFVQGDSPGTVIQDNDVRSQSAGIQLVQTQGIVIRRNTVAGNFSGVVSDATSRNNVVLTNSIFNNVQGFVGPTYYQANATSSPTVVAAPTITNVSPATAKGRNVALRLTGPAGTYRVELFRTPASRTGTGMGEVFLGATDIVKTSADLSGTLMDVPGISDGDRVTATSTVMVVTPPATAATTPRATSVFSNAFTAPGPNGLSQGVSSLNQFRLATLVAASTTTTSTTTTTTTTTTSTTATKTRTI